MIDDGLHLEERLNLEFTDFGRGFGRDPIDDIGNDTEPIPGSLRECPYGYSPYRPGNPFDRGHPCPYMDDTPGGDGAYHCPCKGSGPFM